MWKNKHRYSREHAKAKNANFWCSWDTSAAAMWQKAETFDS